MQHLPPPPIFFCSMVPGNIDAAGQEITPEKEQLLKKMVKDP